MKVRHLLLLLLVCAVVSLLAACAPLSQAPQRPTTALQEAVPAEAGQQSKPQATPQAPAAAAPTQAPAAAARATEAPHPRLTQPAPAGPTHSAPSPTPVRPAQTAPPTGEAHMVEIEWPPRMRLGDSDVVRLALIPTRDGYTLTTEFPNHQAQSRSIQVQRPGGYELLAIARLDGVGFDLSPGDEQAQTLAPGQTLTWRWSLTPRRPGQQRLTISLRLRWLPISAEAGLQREAIIYSQSLNVQVTSFLGLSGAQAMTLGLLSLLFGGGLSFAALVFQPRTPRARPLPTFQPNPALIIEPRPGMQISPGETQLLQTLFRRYQRLVLEKEFLSGYSGARTFLALPVRADGRSDAYTIAKLGGRASIQQEFENYEAFVKDTLPPITARIQQAPVVLSSLNMPGIVSHAEAGAGRDLAALQYTFIGEPGRSPTSLRQALLAEPDAILLVKLFETFGPNWWMQRRPYTFRVGVEYDRLLPVHFLIEPVEEHHASALPLDGRTPPGQISLEAGQIVRLQNFTHAERRSDGVSFSLRGTPPSGQPPLRVRWSQAQLPRQPIGRIVATRLDLLRGLVPDASRCDLPDPFERLPAILEESITGSQAIIHGDLNLENILVGPGHFVWLIDFAQTREGHPLFDFAHLQAEIIAHVLAPQISRTDDYLSILKSAGTPGAQSTAGYAGLLSTLQVLATRCLLNPAQVREYQTGFYVACLGAIKHTNLDAHARHLLYLTAAELVTHL